jgi:hypothetical protein
MTLLLSLWMIGNALGALKPGIRFCGPLQRHAGSSFPFYAGFVLGINVCPPFLMGMSIAMGMKSILQPILFFSGFYIGSSAWLLPLALTGSITRKPFVTRLGNIAAVLIGCWYLVHSVIDIFLVFH